MKRNSSRDDNYVCDHCNEVMVKVGESTFGPLFRCGCTAPLNDEEPPESGPSSQRAS